MLIAVIDSVRRKPLEERYLLLLQRIGLAFILFLVLIATYNDILRVINHFLGRGFIE
jgi:membrane-associated protease RseP (regulator of RpoE activity)